MSRVAHKDGQPCPYCTRTMDTSSLKLRPTSDHVIPKSKSTKLTRSSLTRSVRRHGRTIVVCSECNFMKSDLSLNEFLLALAEKNDILLNSVDTNIERMKNISYLLRIGLEE